jgi:hypothetical protein
MSLCIYSRSSSVQSLIISPERTRLTLPLQLWPSEQHISLLLPLPRQKDRITLQRIMLHTRLVTLMSPVRLHILY